MRTRRKKDISPARPRKRSGAKKVGTWWKSLSPNKVKEALDAVYALEDSRLDPVLAVMQWESLGKKKW